MITDINATSPAGSANKNILDDEIRQFKTDVQESFTNIDAEVAATGRNLQQLADNNFVDNTLKEIDVEVVKLSGAVFTGKVFNADGNDPQEDAQLVTRLGFQRMLDEAFPPPTPTIPYRTYIIDTVQPWVYWEGQETSGTVAIDTIDYYTGNLANGVYRGSSVVLEQASLVPNETRYSVRYVNDVDNGLDNYMLAATPLPIAELPGTYCLAVSLDAPGTLWDESGDIDGVLYSHLVNELPTSSLMIRVNENGVCEAVFRDKDTASINYYVRSSASIVTPGTPHHIVLRVSTTQADLWVDGVKSTYVFPTSIYRNISTAAIAGGNSPGMTGPTNCLVSDVWYTPTEMTDQAITDCYNNWAA